MPIRISIVAFVTLIISTSCGVEIRADATPSQAPLVLTSTIPATLIPQPSETPLPAPPQPTIAPVDGMTSTQVNVRAEPSTASNVLGMIPPNTRVEITGKDPNGGWLQIEFAAGPEGKGWVNAAFVQAQGVDLSGLPIITEEGQIVGTGTPTSIPSTPTATIVPAWEDNDSTTSPVASVIFEPTGTQTLIYNGDLSSPQGDSEDWISFQSYTPLVFASLECKGSDSLEIELIENTGPTSLDIACGDLMKPIAVKAGSTHLFHLTSTLTTGNLQYTNYVLTIKTKSW